MLILHCAHEVGSHADAQDVPFGHGATGKPSLPQVYGYYCVPIAHLFSINDL